MAGSGDEGGESEGVLEELIADAGLEGVVASALRSDFASSPLRKKLSTIRELEDMRKGKEAATAGGSGRTEKHREASAASDTGMRIYEPSKMRATRPITGYQGKQEEPSTNAKLGSQNGPLNFITTNEDDLDLDDLNTSWKSLLEETMSDPHKRRVLQESFDREKSKVRKYHMLLEFSSYLRKPDASPSLSEGAKAGLRRRRRPGSNSANGRSSDSGREGVFAPPPSFERFKKHAYADAGDKTSFARSLLTAAAFIVIIIGGAMYAFPRLVDDDRYDSFV